MFVLRWRARGPCRRAPDLVRGVTLGLLTALLAVSAVGGFGAVGPAPVPRSVGGPTAAPASSAPLGSPPPGSTGYPVTFVESGLIGGTYWSVTLADASNTTSAPGNNSFSETNGTYAYSVRELEGYVLAHPSGSVVVDGARVVVTVAFRLYSFPVTFSEKGLPIATTWYVNFTSTPSGLRPTNLTSRSVNATVDLINGTYAYTTATSSREYYPGPTAPVYVAPGTVVPVPFLPYTYPVAFQEYGLGNGVRWYANVSGVGSWSATVAGSNGTSIAVPLTNGSYSYSLSASEWNWSEGSGTRGTVRVDGAPTTVGGTFAPFPGYAVTFTERNLPRGNTWYVNASRAAPQRATILPASGTVITVGLPNGTSSFQIATNNKAWMTNATGSVRITAEPASVLVIFRAVTYPVRFYEIGLPLRTLWSVSVGGTTNETPAPYNNTVLLTNGTYTYSVGPVPGYVTQWNGSVDVNGSSPPEIRIAFTLVTYALTFSAGGLPSGVPPTVCLAPVGPTPSYDCATLVPSVGGGYAYSYVVVNGSYLYNVSSVDGWRLVSGSGYSGALAVEGLSLVVAMEFAANPAGTFARTFVASGLGEGQVWWLNLTGLPPSAALAGTPILEYLTNGTYPYLSGTDGRLFAPLAPQGNATVAGGGTASIAFARAYAATLEATGLPAGSSWTALVAGRPVPGHATAGEGTNYTYAFTSTTANLTLVLPNGTYTYRLSSNSTAVLPVHPEMSITIAGRLQTIGIRFSPAFTITFTERGLPEGYTWSMTVNGTTLSTHLASIAFVPLANGTYVYAVGPTAGFAPARESGLVRLNGASTGVTVAFSPIAAPTASTPWPAILTVAVVIAAGAAIAVALLVRRRRRLASEREDEDDEGET